MVGGKTSPPGGIAIGFLGKLLRCWRVRYRSVLGMTGRQLLVHGLLVPFLPMLGHCHKVNMSLRFPLREHSVPLIRRVCKAATMFCPWESRTIKSTEGI